MSKKKLLFILPTHYNRDGKLITVKKASVNLNLNLPTLAGMTPAERFDMQLINDYVHPIDPDRHPADLVAMTCLTTAASRTYELADRFRANGAKVVLGGFHVWCKPEEAMAHADAVCFGEAEDVWPQIIDDFLAGRLQGTYRATEQPEMAGRPAPRYDLVNTRDFRIEVFPVESTRGCPFSCDYCAVTAFHGGRHRHRPVGEVVRNIKATGSRYIAFVDDNIVGDKEYARELFQALVPLNIRWMAQSTMLLADDVALADLAIQSGLRFVWVGVESINPQALAEVHRKINQVEEFERRIAEFNRRGIMVGTNIIFGFDNDTPETFKATTEFIIRNKVFPFLYLLTPIPGTRLYDRMRAENRIITEDWRRYTGYDVVFQPKHFTPDGLLDVYYDTVANMFTVGNNFRRARSKIRRRNLKEDFFINLAAFLVGNQVGHAARMRIPDYW